MPPRAIVVTEGSHFGGCLFTTSSLMSAPQPGLVGMIKWPFSILGGSVMEIAQQNLAFFTPAPITDSDLRLVLSQNLFLESWSIQRQQRNRYLNI
jgi:hypothetical protein